MLAKQDSGRNSVIMLWNGYNNEQVMAFNKYIHASP
jgi:hypothetical protein